MSARLLVVALVLLLPLTMAARCGGGGGGATGQSWYVATDGSDANAGTSTASPFLTFAKADSVAGPGDTIFIRGGTYNELIQPSAAGLPDDPITWAAYLGESVVITGTPDVSEGPRCIWVRLMENAHLVFDGITCDGQTLPPGGNLDFGVVLQRSGYVTVKNSTFRNINKRAINIFLPESHHNRILDNLFEYLGQPGQGFGFLGRSVDISQGAHHNLVEGNSGNFVGHNHIVIDNASFNIIRKNSFTNHWWRVANLLGENAEHNFFDQNEMLETARFRPAGVLDIPPAAFEMRAPRNVFRRNVVADGLTFGVRLSSQPGVARLDDNRFYHNTIWRNGSAAWRMNIENEPTAVTDGNILVNNALVENGYIHSLDLDIDQIQIDMDLTSNGCMTDPELCLGGTLFTANLVRDDLSNATTVKVDGIGQFSLNIFTSQYPNHFVGNFPSSNPRFVDAEGLDFRLQSNSGIIDVGNFLTEVSAPGYGSVIPVEDASYFTDGFGLVAGDLIQLEGNPDPVRICMVDYATNLIWVDGFMNWSVGDGVSLAYTGTAPDVGAFEFGLVEGPEPEPCTVGSGSSCGLGFEVAAILPLLAAARRRRLGRR